MGADLIGYLLKGPAKLDPDKDEAALAAVTLRLACREELHQMDILYAGDNSAESKDFMSRWSNKLGMHYLTDFEELYRVDLELGQQELTPQNLVEHFKTAWESRVPSRDTATRADPDDPSQMIVFAGEMSWGDEPGGYGYRLLKMADLMGLLAAYDIR